MKAQCRYCRRFVRVVDGSFIHGHYTEVGGSEICKGGLTEHRYAIPPVEPTMERLYRYATPDERLAALNGMLSEHRTLGEQMRAGELP